ncbi:hypothetical protein [Streptococcus himalayensis]|uniref:hypothetical protein n=1 Tax=Streptococcus himalayensis TaxID=1888195 RepID=UPI00083CC5FC|nr:hypothetical protein [Streptococcus himalayensis]
MKKSFISSEYLFVFFHLYCLIYLYRSQVYEPVSTPLFWLLGLGVLLALAMVLFNYFLYPRWQRGLWPLIFILLTQYILIFLYDGWLIQSLSHLNARPSQIEHVQFMLSLNFWFSPLMMAMDVFHYQDMVHEANHPNSLFGIQFLKNKKKTH